MKLSSLLKILILLSFNKLFAQIPKDSLVGNWQLTALQGKEISESELLKKYSFSSLGDFIYYSPSRTIRGKFRLAPLKGRMTWVHENGKSILFKLTLLPNGTLLIKQVDNNGAPGILSRIVPSK